MNAFLDSNVLAYVNIGLGLAGFTWLLIRTSRRWDEYPREIKLLLTATVLFVLALLEASLEQIVDGKSASFNTIVIFSTKLFLLYVLFTTRGALYRTGTREPGNGDEISPDRDITASHVHADSEQGPQPVEQPGD